MQYVTVERPLGRAWALVTVAKEPVNSFDTALWAALRDAIASLEADATVRGVVIASGLKRDVFTAGNDLKELYAPLTSAERYKDFWLAQSQCLERLYCSRLATVAAIRGACPAGGCCIALCCDARFATPHASMGLNEVAIGIPVPKFWAQLMGRVVGAAAGERLVLSGRMVNATEALQLGLVDALSEGRAQADVLALAQAWVEASVKLPPEARAATKQSGRAEFCAQWRRYYTEEEPAYGWRAISHPAAVKTLKAVLERLSSSGAPPSKL
jgi:3,2-trans-enoyl-CoA isomerase